MTGNHSPTELYGCHRMFKRSAHLAELNLLSIFGERRTQERNKGISRLWIPQGIFVEAGGVHVGKKEVSQAAGSVLAQYPEYEFWVLQASDEIPGAVRLRWAFGMVGRPPAITGQDFLTLAGTRISAMYRFVEGPDF